MKKILLPIIVLGLLSYAAMLLIQMKPEPKAKEVKRKIPFIEVVYAKKQSFRSTILTYGTVRPRTSTTLIAEVPGIIQEVAPIRNGNQKSATFLTGGFFQKGELLLKIEDTDLITLEAEALANFRRAELQLFQEQELSKQAKIEWGGRDWNAASDLVKRIPQIQKAMAETKAAEARLVQSSLDVKRSEVRAPFQGRILKTMVDVGQQVGAGASSALAEIYALKSAEINLSLSRSEMNFLGFLDGARMDNKLSVKTDVLDLNGMVIHEGMLERSEGVVDPRTRLTNLIAQVDNCFANPFSEKTVIHPLTVGQFVNLRLQGKKIDVFQIPESAFRTQDTILVVNEENKLLTRNVSVIHRSNKLAWVTTGLSDGEIVCITPIEIISESMPVKIVNLPEDSNKTLP